MANKHEDSEAMHNKRDFNDLRRAVVATFSSSMARIVARILLILYVVKLYGLGSFGYLGEVAAYIELLAALSCLGLPKTIMAYFDRNKSDERKSANLVANAICLTAIIGLLSSLVLALVWPFLFPIDAHVPIYIASAVLIVAITEIMLTLTRSRRIIRWEAMVKGLVKPWGFFLFAMFGYLILVKQYSMEPIIVLMAAYFASLLLSALCAFIGFRQILENGQITVGKANIKSIYALGRESAPIAVVDAGSFAFRRLDIIILGWMTNSDMTGIYYLGQQLATVVEKMRHLFEPIASPILAQTQSIKTIGQYLQKTCLWIFSACLGLTICFVVFAVPTMALFDIYFASAAILMAALLTAEIADGSTGLAELPIIFRDPLYASYNVVIVLIVEGISVAIGAFYYGILGAAIGFAIGMITLACLRLWVVKKLYAIQIVDNNYLKPICAGILTIIIGYMTRDFFLSFDDFGTILIGSLGSFSLGIIGHILGFITCLGVYLMTLKAMGVSMKIADNS